MSIAHTFNSKLSHAYKLSTIILYAQLAHRRCLEQSKQSVTAVAAEEEQFINTLSHQLEDNADNVTHNMADQQASLQTLDTHMGTSTSACIEVKLILSRLNDLVKLCTYNMVKMLVVSHPTM